MATAGIIIKGSFPGLKEVADGIRGIGDTKFTAETLKAALLKAIVPAYMRLKELSPVGPTGNLKAAATYLAKAYPKNGGAVGLIGYRRSGKKPSVSAAGGSVRKTKGKLGDRAYHQWIVEYGTSGRAIKKPIELKQFQRKSPSTPYVRIRKGHVETVRGSGIEHTVRPTAGGTYYIASSFKELGPFKFVKGAGGMQTDPAYPNAFFMKSKGALVLPPMPAGGTAGVPPLRSAFIQTQSTVAAILQQELRISFDAAIETLAFKASGSISGVI